MPALDRDGTIERAATDVHKATGLAALAERNGIRREEIIAIGDNVNDLEMLQDAGLSVAMGNASDQVKPAAQLVTATNDEDGVAGLPDGRSGPSSPQPIPNPFFSQS